MSIVAYVGKPGSGKSFQVVEHVILPALKAGRPLWTNIPLQQESVAEAFPLADYRVLANDEVIDALPEIPGGAVIVLDEVWRLWPQGLQSNKVPEADRSFFAEHRHRVGENGLSQEIVLITQDLSQIAAFARKLIEETFVASKLSAVGQKGRYRVDMYSGAVSGDKPPKNQRLRQEYGKYREDIWRFYKSHTMSSSDGAVREEKMDGRLNVWRSPLLRLAIPAALCAMAWGAYTVYQFFSGDWVTAKHGGQVVSPVVAQQAGVPSQATSAVAVAAVPAVPPVSRSWRLAGIYGARGREIVVLVDSASGSAVKLQLRRACEREVGTDFWVCEFQGERVTRFSGGSDRYAQSPTRVLSEGLGNAGSNIRRVGE